MFTSRCRGRTLSSAFIAIFIAFTLVGTKLTFRTFGTLRYSVFLTLVKFSGSKIRLVHKRRTCLQSHPLSPSHLMSLTGYSPLLCLNLNITLKMHYFEKSPLNIFTLNLSFFICFFPFSLVKIIHLLTFPFGFLKESQF